MYIHNLGTPPSPFNLTSFIKEYHDSFYSITLSWAAAQFLVDYYMMTVISGAGILQNESILAHNTSNNLQIPSIVISNLPYNENITVLLSAHNCIGSSPPDSITFDIGKFNIMDSYVSLACSYLTYNNNCYNDCTCIKFLAPFVGLDNFYYIIIL